MPKNNSVSIVIPNRNYAAFLPDAIESCLQTVPPCEIIVVDGESSDDSLRIVADYGVKLLRVASAMVGNFAAMGRPKNVGIEKAIGEHIICLDADDKLAPNYIEKCLACMTPDVGIVSTGVQCFGDSDRNWNPPAQLSLADMVKGNQIFTASMFRKSAWQAVGGFTEEPTFEDWDLWIRIMAEGWKIAVVPEPLFHYRCHKTSLTQGIPPEYTNALKLAMREKHAHLLLRSAPVAARSTSENYVHMDIDGWMEEPELQWLYQTAKQMDSIVEIGSWKGRSTHALCSGCPGTVTAVDHFMGSKGYHLMGEDAKDDGVYRQFQENTKQFTNLKVLRGDSVEIAKEFADGSIDMVFIDGDHTEAGVRADIQAWLPKARKVIAGHDYSRHFPGICKAVDEKFGVVEHAAASIWFKQVEKSAVKPAATLGSMILKKNNLTIYARDGAGRAGDQAIVTEQFDMDIYRIQQLAKLIRPQTILDIGGHIGVVGLNMLSTWPTARLVAYEPKSDSADLYRKNLAENGLNGTVWTKAVSYEPGKTMLSDNPAWTGGGIMVNAETQKALPGHYRISESEVAVVDLEEVLRANSLERVDLLKLDCEGAEMGMLRHMKAETARKIGFIVGEYHCQTGSYVFHGADNPKDRIKGYDGFAELIQWRFPWFECMPLGQPSNNIGNFAAGPPEIIAQLKTQASKNGVFPVRTPLGNQIVLTFFDGAKVEINGDAEAEYEVRFNNLDTGENVYTTVIKPGYWAAANPKYYVRWGIVVSENGQQVLDFALDLTGKSVWIGLTSKSLGDTLCWMPYAEEFRKQHDCEVIVETFWRSLLESEYPEIRFCDNATFRGDVYAGYKVGCWDNDYNRNPINWRVIPLQQVACDILGLEYKEIKPKVKRSGNPKAVLGKYVCVSEFSTLQCKFWNHPKGWQTVADYLNGHDLKVISVGESWPRTGSRSARTAIKGAIAHNGLSVEETLPIIQNAEFFIGVGAGYSWLAWALNVPVVLISGFSDPFIEMKDCMRVHNPSVCHGCYNDPSLPFERNNWNWCPRGKNFECSKTITPEMVIEKIRPLAEKWAGSTGPTGALGLTPGIPADVSHMALSEKQMKSADPVRVLMLCPHLSTGGLPQYALWRLKKYQQEGALVEVVEWRCLSQEYTVQRKRIQQLCRLHEFSFSDSGRKLRRLERVLEDFRPSIVHIQEFPEHNWGEHQLFEALYTSSRDYEIVETCHYSGFRLEDKRWFPDRIEVVSLYHQRLFKALGVPVNLMEYAPEYQKLTLPRSEALAALGLSSSKKHILNVGLFTPGKNQGEIFEIARRMPEVEFHFVGNQAPNFANYWKPLMADRPHNCTIWGERDDVDGFYAAMDALLFTSKSELAPLVPREALAWGMPVLMQNLPIYEGMYDGVLGVTFINDDLERTISALRRSLGV